MILIGHIVIALIGGWTANILVKKYLTKHSKGCQSNLVLRSVMTIKQTIYMILGLFYGLVIGYNCIGFCRNIAYLYMQNNYDLVSGAKLGGLFLIPLIILSVWASNELYIFITNKRNLSKFKHFLFVILGVSTSFIFANGWHRIAFRTFEQVQWFGNGNQRNLVILIGHTVIAIICGWTANILVKKYLTNHPT